MKTMNYVLSAVAALVLVASCNNAQKSTSENSVEEQKLENRPFVSDTTKEKLDFFLNIVGEEATDSTIIYTVKSLFETDTVGLKIEVLKQIPAGISENGEGLESGFIEGAIKFKSIGEQSDNFVKAIQKLYRIEGTGKISSEEISPLVFSSNKKAVNLVEQHNDTYSFKLFLKNPFGAEAEVFAVLDNYRKSFSISEKDSTFRAQVLSAFEAN